LYPLTAVDEDRAFEERFRRANTSVDQRITALEEAVEALSATVSSNTADISANVASIASNAATISTNVSSISTHTAEIAANSGDIASNTSAISDNAADISSNSSAITGSAYPIVSSWNSSTPSNDMWAWNTVSSGYATPNSTSPPNEHFSFVPDGGGEFVTWSGSRINLLVARTGNFRVMFQFVVHTTYTSTLGHRFRLVKNGLEDSFMETNVVMQGLEASVCIQVWYDRDVSWTSGDTIGIQSTASSAGHGLYLSDLKVFAFRVY
jgi:hypothetical protein